MDQHDRAGLERRAEAVHEDGPDLHVTRDTSSIPASQPYYWTAISATTGATVFKVYAGNGLAYNNNYAGLGIGPDGTAYLATAGGMLALRDGS